MLTTNWDCVEEPKIPPHLKDFGTKLARHYFPPLVVTDLSRNTASEDQPQMLVDLMWGDAKKVLHSFIGNSFYSATRDMLGRALCQAFREDLHPWLHFAILPSIYEVGNDVNLIASNLPTRVLFKGPSFMRQTGISLQALNQLFPSRQVAQDVLEIRGGQWRIWHGERSQNVEQLPEGEESPVRAIWATHERTLSPWESYDENNI